ncbi:EamA domain [Sesbania bispinosa]|nr:EamA domain [Sesbania bispinosa]
MEDLGIFSVMLAIEMLEVTVNTVSKAAMKRGMNNFVFIMKRTLPPLTYWSIGLLFVAGFFSCTIQMLKFFGIAYSSPTLASVMSDLVPAFTFILAVFCRMENFDYKANSTQVKSYGTLVSITGALIITLYKGQPIINNHPNFPENLLSSEQFDWIFGGVLLAAFSCMLSFHHIVLTWLIREYPAELMVVLIRSMIVSVLSVPAVLISEKDPKAWRLGLNMELLAIGCSAVFTGCFRSVIHIWAMKKKGPVYVAMFKPLEIVFAVLMGIAFLGDSLYLGSVIGAAVVVIGFYAVIWGKTEEEKVKENCKVDGFVSDSPEVPLLQNRGMDRQ